MIAHITGKIIRRKGNTLVIDVGGIGYGVTVSTYTFGKTIGQEDINMYIYTHVREQEITLYGFQSEREQELFEALLTISGVGPKAAMNILSIADPQTILTAIAHADASLLTKVSGIGKKTAERIVLELGNKVQKLIAQMPEEDEKSVSYDTDAIDALVGLGYSVTEARDALSESAIGCDADVDISTRIRAALKYLGRKR